MPKQSKESIDSGCQNETNQNSEHIRNSSDGDGDTWRHCDLKIVDITKHISSNRKKDTLDLAVNCRKSSSSTLSDASSCGTNRSTDQQQERKRKDSPKYHSVIKNRLRKDASVSRSKSFQEQDVRKPNTRFYILRRNPNNEFDNEYKLSKTISHHNIEITIEDTDAIDEPINHSTILKPRKKPKQSECSSLNSRELKYQRSKIRSGHILSRIFRRMRNLSMAWRRSKNKTRTRGEFPFKMSFVLVFRLTKLNQYCPLATQ